MGRADYYLHGDYNGICDLCGFKYKAKDLRMTWDGLFVCQKDWEPRHPQDKLRAIKDDQSVSIPRPEDDWVFLNAGDVTVDDL